MSHVRKSIVIVSFILFASSLGIAIALYSKAKAIDNQVFAEYVQFCKAHTTVFGNEGFYDTAENAKKGSQLLHAAMAKTLGSSG